MELKNEYGVELDHNGYAPSLLSKDTVCYICGTVPVERHEIFHGFNRQKSKAYGTWINLCRTHHNEMHNDNDLQMSFKIMAQKRAMIHYGWTVADFRKRYGKNYLDEGVIEDA